MKIETAKVVKVYPTAVWIESGFSGERRVMLQHEGCEPFTYATFGYDYRYTSNAGTWEAAHALALSLGATEPVEVRAETQKNEGYDDPLGEWLLDMEGALEEAENALMRHDDERSQAALVRVRAALNDKPDSESSTNSLQEKP